MTATFGAYDDIKRLPPHPGVDAFCFTDEETRCDVPPSVTSSWTKIIAPRYPRHDFPPALRAKYFKLQIQRVEDMDPYRWLVWADASLQFHDLTFLNDLADRLAAVEPRNRRIALVPHPERTTVLEEFKYVTGQMAAGNQYLIDRYGKEKMNEQIAAYRALGWSLENGLWCGGFWMIENNEPIRRCWDDWWGDNLRFGMMDQLSLPVWLANHEIEPETLDVSIWDNQHWTYVPYLAERESRQQGQTEQ